MKKIAKYLANECSLEERQEVEKWLADSESNQQQFKRYQKAWETAQTTQNLCNPTLTKAWNNISTKCNLKQKDHSQRNQWLAVAALFLGICMLSFLFTNTSQNNELENELVWKIVNTQPNEKTTFIVLSDSTKIWLNKDSQLRYPEKYAQNKRQVYLKGEAFFDVAKNPNKSFEIIMENDVTVKVLGTSFNINTHQENIEVDVFSGKVAFGKDKNTLNLLKGMRGVLNKSTENLEKEILDENALAWKTGILTFRKTALKDVLKQLNTHYNANLLVESNYQDKEVSVTFDNQTLSDVTEILELTLGETQIIQNLEHK